ncbi:tetratricopeptide repeat protein 1 [Halichoeres trimaculatus]|uniref:tetratricopeptide repeat protein 1 n=1 Tax=Halichoeres trimaculatus TaxID=147232 RepID=UPI003D9F22F7
MSCREEKSREEQEEEQEDFYDCQETLQHLDLRGGEEDKEVPKHITTDRLMDGRDNTEIERGGQEEGQGEGSQEERLQEERLQEERLQGERLPEERLPEERLPEERPQEERLPEERLQDDGLQDDGLEDDSELEMKDEVVNEAEFDDEYLKEVEMGLTEEEKESRRQQSLSLKERGNSQFKSGDWREAELSYKEALVLCPVCFSRERAVLFSNRAAARLHLDLKEQAIADCTKAIELNPEYVRALLRRAELYEQTEKLDEALEDYKKALDIDPNQTTARQACMRLPGQIQERNEKLKEEMLGKLKDLGNLVLRPFGLSTNNFQVNQDAQTGSYSINFVQNPNNNNNT